MYRFAIEYPEGRPINLKALGAEIIEFDRDNSEMTVSIADPAPFMEWEKLQHSVNNLSYKRDLSTPKIGIMKDCFIKASNYPDEVTIGWNVRYIDTDEFANRVDAVKLPKKKIKKLNKLEPPEPNLLHNLLHFFFKK